jgi:hypothetical protein
MPSTWCPRLNSSVTMRDPAFPVAPMTAIFMQYLLIDIPVY